MWGVWLQVRLCCNFGFGRFSVFLTVDPWPRNEVSTRGFLDLFLTPNFYRQILKGIRIPRETSSLKVRFSHGCDVDTGCFCPLSLHSNIFFGGGWCFCWYLWSFLPLVNKNYAKIPPIRQPFLGICVPPKSIHYQGTLIYPSPWGSYGFMRFQNTHW